jgi:hypothetical protein
MTLPDEYRRHAETCRLLAETIDPGHERLALLKMAEAWQELAATQERRDKSN